jgi:peptide/nickel transport system substrate-binding protein
MPMEKSAFFAALLGAETPDFDLALNGYVMGSEPSDYASVFATGGGNNASHYSNPEIDAKFEAALKETDTAKRDAIYKEIQQTIVDELALYPIAYGKSLVAIDKNYDGVEEANPAPIFMFRDLNKLKLK